MANDPEGMGLVPVQCPYCGEPIELAVDVPAGPQRYVEDCAVCCRPIEVAIDVDEAGVRVRVQQENEA